MLFHFLCVFNVFQVFLFYLNFHHDVFNDEVVECVNSFAPCCLFTCHPCTHHILLLLKLIHYWFVICLLLFIRIDRSAPSLSICLPADSSRRMRWLEFVVWLELGRCLAAALPGRAWRGHGSLPLCLPACLPAATGHTQVRKTRLMRVRERIELVRFNSMKFVVFHV